jgi:hypothetical protein
LIAVGNQLGEVETALPMLALQSELTRVVTDGNPHTGVVRGANWNGCRVHR